MSLAFISALGGSGLFGQKQTRLEKQASGQLSPAEVQTRMEKWLLGTVAENKDGFQHPDFRRAWALAGSPRWGSGLGKSPEQIAKVASGQSRSLTKTYFGLAWYWIALIVGLLVGGFLMIFKKKKRRRR